MLTKGQLRVPLRVFTVLALLSVCISVGIIVVMVMRSYIGFGITANNLSCVSGINYFNTKYNYPSITTSFAGAVIAVICGTTAFIITLVTLVKLGSSTLEDNQIYIEFTQAKINAISILYMISVIELIIPTGYYLSFVIQVATKCSSYSVSLFWIIIDLLSTLALVLYIFCIFYMIKLVSNSSNEKKEDEAPEKKEKQETIKNQIEKKSEPQIIVEPPPAKEQEVPLLDKNPPKQKQIVIIPQIKKQKQEPKSTKKKKEKNRQKNKNPSSQQPQAPLSPISQTVEPPHQNNTNIHFHFSPGSFNGSNPPQVITQSPSSLSPQYQVIKNAQGRAASKTNKRPNKKKQLMEQQVITESKEEYLSSDSDDRFYKKQKPKRNQKNRLYDKERFKTNRNFVRQYGENVHPDLLAPPVKSDETVYQDKKKSHYISQQAKQIPNQSHLLQNLNDPHNQNKINSPLLSESIVNHPQEPLYKQSRRLEESKVQVVKQDSFYKELQQNQPKQSLDLHKLATFFKPRHHEKEEVATDQYKIKQNTLDQYIADLNQSYAQISRQNHQEQTNYLSQNNYQSVLSQLEASRQVSENTGNPKSNFEYLKATKSGVKPMLLIDFIRKKYS